MQNLQRNAEFTSIQPISQPESVGQKKFETW